MSYQISNPILALVGATASVGNSMFAEELFNVEFCESLNGLDALTNEGKFDGMTSVNMCRVIHSRIAIWAEY